MTWKMTVAVIPSVLFSGFKGKTFFIFIHGDDILKLNSLYSSILRFICNKPNVFIISNSLHTSSLLDDAVGYKADAIFPPFIDTHMDRVDKNSSRSDTFEILTLTRLVKRKNVISVLKALELLHKDGYSFTYNIAGDGPERSKIHEYLENSLIKTQRYIVEMVL